MAKKKKRVVKKTIKRKTAKKPVIKKRKVRYSSRKIKLVLRNLFLFVVLFILSLILYSISGTEFYKNLFLLIGVVFGFISLAFLIVLLVFVFLKFLNK